jgi:hypothetical protein
MSLFWGKGGRRVGSKKGEIVFCILYENRRKPVEIVLRIGGRRKRNSD